MSKQPQQVVSNEELKQFSSGTMEQAFSGTGHTGRVTEDVKKCDSKTRECK